MKLGVKGLTFSLTVYYDAIPIMKECEACMWAKVRSGTTETPSYYIYMLSFLYRSPSTMIFWDLWMNSIAPFYRGLVLFIFLLLFLYSTVKCL